MGVIQSVGGVVLVLVLTVSLFAANGVVLAERTALNGDFVKSTLEENEGYEAMQSVGVDIAVEQSSAWQSQVPFEIDFESVVEEVVTTTYLEREVETNVDRVYGYLHGERESLLIAVNLTPVKSRLAAHVEERIQNMTVTELVDFVASQQDLSVEVQGVELDLADVGEMAKGPEEYEQVRQAFRDDVVQQLVNQQYQQRSNDQLLFLIIPDYDPREYSESEKQRMVRNNETEIKTELDTRIRESGEVDDQLAALGDSIDGAVSSTVAGAVPERFQPVVGPATDLVLVGTDGLTQNMSYATFDDRITSAKADLAANVSPVLESELDETVGDRRVLSNRLSPSQMDAMEQAKSAVGLVGLLAILLPVLCVALIAGLYLVTGSLTTTGVGAGLSLAVVGALSFAASSAVPGLVESYMPPDLPTEVADLAQGVLEHVTGAFGAQSFVLLALGVVGIGAAIALRYRDAGDEGGDLGPPPGPEPAPDAE